MDEFTLDPHLLYSDWILTETEFEPKQLNYKETVFTIGNGYRANASKLLLTKTWVYEST
jgi:hypothetical protein